MNCINLLKETNKGDLKEMEARGFIEIGKEFLKNYQYPDYKPYFDLIT
jgi:hypothetical protein